MRVYGRFCTCAGCKLPAASMLKFSLYYNRVVLLVIDTYVVILGLHASNQVWTVWIPLSPEKNSSLSIRVKLDPAVKDRSSSASTQGTLTADEEKPLPQTSKQKRAARDYSMLSWECMRSSIRTWFYSGMMVSAAAGSRYRFRLMARRKRKLQSQWYPGCKKKSSYWNWVINWGELVNDVGCPDAYDGLENGLRLL
jgi:hypothetical protein